jgi:DNA-binding response OmpR family regulator
MNIKQAKILLVEDDLFLRDLYVSKLKKEGFENILVAGNGEEGLEMVNKNIPDLVLLDIILPQMSGFDVLEKVKKDNNLSQIPIILLTNLGQKEDVEKGYKLGADDYIIKANFTPQQVVEKIQKVLASK